MSGVRKGMITAALALAALAALAEPARAQRGMAPYEGQLTGHIGLATGGDGRGTTASIGAAVGIIGQSGWGAEFDIGYADDDNGRTGGLDAQSYILSVVGRWPAGRIRPFVTAGGGVLRARTCTAGCAATTAWTDWALSGGGGVQYLLNDATALRLDVRYLTAPGNHPDPTRPRSFAFWRVAVGATYRWNIIE